MEICKMLGIVKKTIDLFEAWYDPLNFGLNKDKMYIRYIKSTNCFVLKPMEDEAMEESENFRAGFFFDSEEKTKQILDLFDESEESFPVTVLVKHNKPGGFSYTPFREVEWTISKIVHRRIVNNSFRYKVIWSSCHGQNFIG